MRMDTWNIQPLADNYCELYKSNDPQNLYCGTPGLAICPNGRIIAVFEIGGPTLDKTIVNTKKDPPRGFIYTSDDHGKTWIYRNSFPIVHLRVFLAGESLYIIGHNGDLRIVRSDDCGNTWGDFVSLTQNQQWHASAANVWYKGDNIYFVMERRTNTAVKGWAPSELAPVLMRANVKKDLTKKENWTFASEMTFYENVEDQNLDWFGVPFYDGYYPNVKKNIGGKATFYPVGWLEANVVQIIDPQHYWYDPYGKTFHIFMRANTGITNLGCVIKAVEHDNGTIKTMFQFAPSGKRQLFIPIPGGQMKFYITYDEKTNLYWLLGTQSTDSMTRPEMLSPDRYDLADNERCRLVLHFSKNMVDWCFAGVVSIGQSEHSSRHYASMVIDGDDLYVLSRSGDLCAKSTHDCNIITFHTIKNFRRLIY